MHLSYLHWITPSTILWSFLIVILIITIFKYVYYWRSDTVHQICCKSWSSMMAIPEHALKHIHTNAHIRKYCCLQCFVIPPSQSTSWFWAQEIILIPGPWHPQHLLLVEHRLVPHLVHGLVWAAASELIETSTGSVGGKQNTCVCWTDGSRDRMQQRPGEGLTLKQGGTRVWGMVEREGGQHCHGSSSGNRELTL